MQQGRVAGLVTPGDGGRGAEYTRILGQPTYTHGWFRSEDRFCPDGSTSSADGGYWIYSPPTDDFNACHIGAVNDNTGDTVIGLVNHAVAKAIVDITYDRGGGTVVYPKGHFQFHNPTPLVAGSAIPLRSGVSLRGAGVGVTTIEVLPWSNLHGVNQSGQDYISVSDFSFLGNGLEHTLGVHGCRIGDNGGIFVSYARLCIYNARGYGIGLQGDGAGDNSHISLEDIFIYRAGRDGIDIKDRSGGNVDIKIRGVCLVEPGYRLSLSTTESFTGLDLRGVCDVKGVQVYGLYAPAGNDMMGVRVRPPNPSSPERLGGKRSQISGVYVEGAAVQGGGRTIGVNIEDEQVTVSGATVNGGWRGFNFAAARCAGANLVATNFTEVGCSLSALSDAVQIANLNLKTDQPNTTGLSVEAGATNFQISGLIVDGAETGTLLGPGTTGTITGDRYYNCMTNVGDASGLVDFGWDAASSSDSGIGPTINSNETLNLASRGFVTTVTNANQISYMRLRERRRRTLLFESTPRIVGNAAVDVMAGQISPIILPGDGSNIIAAAGDTMEVIGMVDGLGAPYVQCIDWKPLHLHQILSASIAAGSAVSLTDENAANITSIALPRAGTYEIGGSVTFVGGASVSVTEVTGWLSQTSATKPASSTITTPSAQLAALSPGATPFSVAIPTGFVTVGTTPGSVYLGARADFASDTLAAYGYLWVKRVR